MKTTRILITVIFITTFQLLSAEPLLSENEWSRLRAGEHITRTAIWSDSVSTLAPQDSIAQKKTVESEQTAEGMSIASLGLIPYPESWMGMSEQERQLEIFNLFHRVSTLTGFDYGDKEKTLFTDSYSIADPEKKKSKIADPYTQALPASDRVFICQDDTIFGTNVYQNSYTVSENEVFVDITNLTAMKFLGISIVKPEDLSLCLSATQSEEGILLYTRTTLATREPMMSFLFWSFDLADESLQRMEAYQRWFTQEVAS